MMFSYYCKNPLCPACNRPFLSAIPLTSSLRCSQCSADSDLVVQAVALTATSWFGMPFAERAASTSSRGGRKSIVNGPLYEYDPSMTTASSLIIETGDNPQYSIIFLHGLGADANDFAPFANELQLPAAHTYRFVFPNAPVQPITINNHF